MHWTLKVSVHLDDCVRRFLQDVWLDMVRRVLLVVVLCMMSHMLLEAQQSHQLQQLSMARAPKSLLALFGTQSPSSR